MASSVLVLESLGGFAGGGYLAERLGSNGEAKVGLTSGMGSARVICLELIVPLVCELHLGYFLLHRGFLSRNSQLQLVVKGLVLLYLVLNLTLRRGILVL